MNYLLFNNIFIQHKNICYNSKLYFFMNMSAPPTLVYSTSHNSIKYSGQGDNLIDDYFFICRVCVGMQVPPATSENWYCRLCISKKQGQHHDKKKKKRKKRVKIVSQMPIMISKKYIFDFILLIYIYVSNSSKFN